MTVFKLSDPLTFGKHRGRTLEQVIHGDPQYIRWCLRTIEWFEIDKPAVIELLNTLDEPSESNIDLGTGGFCPDGEYPVSYPNDEIANEEWEVRDELTGNLTVHRRSMAGNWMETVTYHPDGSGYLHGAMGDLYFNEHGDI